MSRGAVKIAEGITARVVLADDRYRLVERCVGPLTKELVLEVSDGKDAMGDFRWGAAGAQIEARVWLCARLRSVIDAGRDLVKQALAVTSGMPAAVGPEEDSLLRRLAKLAHTFESRVRGEEHVDV